MGNDGFIFDGTYRQAYDRLIAHEKGYVNHPNDRGGRTIDGIAERFHPEDFATAYRLYRSGDTQAFEQFKYDFYKREYWDANNIGSITDFGARYAAFDIAVNSGGEKSQELFQTAISNDGRVDGVEMANLQRANYANIIRQNPSQAVFRNGWNNRADTNELIGSATTQFWEATDQGYFEDLMSAAPQERGEPWQLIERAEVNYNDPVSLSRVDLFKGQEALKIIIDTRSENGRANGPVKQIDIYAEEVEANEQVWASRAIHDNAVTATIDSGLTAITNIFSDEARPMEGDLRILDIANKKITDEGLTGEAAAMGKYLIAREAGIEPERLLIVRYDASPGEAGGQSYGLLFFADDGKQFFALDKSRELFTEQNFNENFEVPWGGFNENTAVYSPNYNNTFAEYVNDDPVRVASNNQITDPGIL